VNAQIVSSFCKERLTSSSSEPLSRWVRSTRTGWPRGGRSDGIPILLTSPWPESIYCFRGILPAIKEPGPLILVDLPGTPGLLNGLGKSGQQDALNSGLIARTPIGRMGLPEETAAVALFLASEDSSFMTGSEVFVDGGMAQV
jgi:hypothetical protein